MEHMIREEGWIPIAVERGELRVRRTLRYGAATENGRPEWTRTIDLFRVKEAL
jgi:hypothetical protein